MDLQSQPHRRFNALTAEWVLVSPHRRERPWQGELESSGSMRSSFDPDCYLCPGNVRANGEANPNYAETFVFANDFPALIPDAAVEDGPTGLTWAKPVRGECRVVCYSPRHDLTMAEMPVEAIRRVVDVWSEQIAELGERYASVQVFENKGAAMGCSNPHPHGQIWACDVVPTIVSLEGRNQAYYQQELGRSLLGHYVEKELEACERIVLESERWVWLVPFWAVWPFETMLLPKRDVKRLPGLTTEERDDLAAILRSGLQKYDRLFGTSFPYSMGWHGAPFVEDDLGWHLHAHFYPPLLRSASVRKFMVGYEMLAEAQRDLTAEEAAERLRRA